ncbi:zinc finger and SCAN domain-containing protein 21 isoform X2 [Astyanax mexicanus]|uniref:zinc finger and SCAN domain-containing protein 21 isoform X2 n=1 Tax=Astyanax mexicanus TaxID=7994 RepID=UPI0020CAC9D9|nr:zinc finger and SCAN domain-containing protein 21 isoform X2 [Astyanax mexicanus]
MVRTCDYPGCSNKDVADSPQSFHRFPVTDVALRKLWVLALGIHVDTKVEKIKKLRVCSAHFSDDDFLSTCPGQRQMKKRILKKSAVPAPQILEPFDFSIKEEPPADPEYGSPDLGKLRGSGGGLFNKEPPADPVYLLEPIDFSSKEEPPADPAYGNMELVYLSDEFLSDFESPEEEEKKKKTKKNQNNSSSDEWEPPAQETTMDSDSSEVSLEEEEDEESDGPGDVADEGSMPVVGCKECDSEATLQCSILKHKKVFACPQCVSGDGSDDCLFEKLFVRFDDFKNFQIHVKQEHRVTAKRVLCQECGIFYVTPTEANGKKEHVCEYKTKQFVCLECDNRFRTEQGLKAHAQKLHGNMLHPCKYCLKPFHNRPAKLEHEDTHPKAEKPYMCTDCPEKFSNILKRNRHLRSHQGPWKYICKTCGKGFPYPDRLERHELIHSGEKPFRCEVCDRSFSQDGHLKSHMRLHTGEKPYKCKFCEKSFNHNVSLKSHVLRYHSSEAPHTEGAVKKSVPKTKKKKIHPVRPRGRPKQVLGNEEQELS